MTDITRSTMRESRKDNPTGTFLDQAKELLARFPQVAAAELLAYVTAHYLIDFQYGNKRAEREACNFLNQLQHEAVKLSDRQNQTNA